jgi:hypothetical protein
VPVLPDERGGRQFGVEAFGAGRDRPGSRRHVLHRHGLRQRHEHVHALGPAGLHDARQAGVVQYLADQPGGGHRQLEPGALRRVQIHDQVGGPDLAGEHQRRVVFHGALVGEPQQGAAVVAEGVRHLAVGRLGPDLGAGYPVGRVLRQVLLHEPVLAAQHPHHRQRPVPQHRQDPVADRVQIVDEVPLGGAGSGKQLGVQVGQGYAVPLFARHADHPARSRVLPSARSGPQPVRCLSPVRRCRAPGAPWRA